MNKKADLLISALANLPEQFRYEILTKGCSHELFHDAKVAIASTSGKQRFNVEVRNIHRKASLDTIKELASENTLLVCNKLSDHLANYCESNGINFIDAAGNTRIHSGGLTLWISGKSLPKPMSGFQNRNHKMTLGSAKLVFVILNDETTLNLSYRELAALSNISLGMVSKGMTFLKENGYLHHRRLVGRDELTQLWLREYKTALRPKLGGITLDLKHPWQEIDIMPPDIWGGEVAATRLTHYLFPEKLQLFTFESTQRMISRLGARPAPTGNLWLVPAFWGYDLHLNENIIALLSAAELLASGDSRNYETAQLLNEQYLHLKTFPKPGF